MVFFPNFKPIYTNPIGFFFEPPFGPAIPVTDTHTLALLILLRLFTIERQHALFRKADRTLRDLGYRAKTFYGDWFKGKAVFGPFDGIIVTCGAPIIPEQLKNQLKINGRNISNNNIKQLKSLNEGLGSVREVLLNNSQIHLTNYFRPQH